LSDLAGKGSHRASGHNWTNLGQAGQIWVEHDDARGVVQIDTGSSPATTGVAVWSGARPPLLDAQAFPAEAIAALRDHPRFPEAMRRATEAWVDLYQGNRLLNLMVNDRGRFWVSLLTVHLHRVSCDDDPRPGLTVNRMKRLCVEQDICSRGRAETLIVLMRLFGYLAPAPGAPDRGRRWLIPTDLMLNLHRDRVRASLEAMALVMPEAARALSYVEHHNYIVAHVSSICDQLLRGFRLTQLVPGLAGFADRNAGVVIVMSIALAGDPGDTFPPTGPVSISQSAIARQFGVSRVHVRRLLNYAIEEGFLERTSPNSDVFRLLPRLSEMLQEWFAMHFLFVAHCAGAAVAEIEADDVAD
jgi:hypothetical protein